jgi:hypothetical protein
MEIFNGFYIRHGHLHAQAAKAQKKRHNFAVFTVLGLNRGFRFLVWQTNTGKFCVPWLSMENRPEFGLFSWKDVFSSLEEQ